MPAKKNEVDKTKESDEKYNFKNGEKLVENAVFCLLNSRSVKDYVKLNSKYQLPDPNFPTKNYGVETFFKIRKVVFEELNDALREQKLQSEKFPTQF